jgi:hypothetical protein
MFYYSFMHALTLLIKRFYHVLNEEVRNQFALFRLFFTDWALLLLRKTHPDASPTERVTTLGGEWAADLVLAD